MNKLTLGTVAVLVTVAMMSSALIVMPIQEVDARKTSIRNTAENRCTGSGTTCLAGAQQTIQTSETSKISAKNKASNECSAGAFCQSQAIQFIESGETSKISAKNKASNECSGSGTTCLAGAQQTIRPGGSPAP